MQIRVHGLSDRPTLIYFPGLHGDWTLIGSFREAIGAHVHLVELEYPCTTSMTVDDYVDEVYRCFKERGIHEGWLLGESFGSVLVWPVLEQAERRGFQVKGVILAAGFVHYPIPMLVNLARWLNRFMPLFCIKMLCWGIHARLRRGRGSRHVEAVEQFVRRRTTEADRQAICHRYTLIRRSDPRNIACETSVPIFHLAGFFDPIVPWFMVRRWIRRHCGSQKGWRLIWRADHNVLGTAPHIAAEQIIFWMNARR